MVPYSPQGLRFAEGGQSSTGSSLAWFRRMINSQITTTTTTTQTQPQPLVQPSQSQSQQPSQSDSATGTATATGTTAGAATSTTPAPALAPVSEPTAPALALVSYASLDAEAALLPIGAEGLLAIETFQGSRTPVTDSEAR